MLRFDLAAIFAAEDVVLHLAEWRPIVISKRGGDGWYPLSPAIRG
jgi:hypothetical protein